MTAYYNEIDPYCAAWLRNLIAANLIAPGVVDERDIRDVAPADLAGYTQCHFFAGIGGWSRALRLAAWPDHRPVWTGSCPCQPFSVAGKAGGFADERHLWPYWHHLIAQCRPAIIFGEQVASPAGLGWFDLVHADLEDEDYAVGVADLCAAGVGAPHIRQRLWFVADAAADGCAEGLASGIHSGNSRNGFAHDGGLGNSLSTRLAQRSIAADGRGALRSEGTAASAPGAQDGFWSDAQWLQCSDGRRRPAQPGSFPLAHGIPQRVAKLRALGNAIIPQVAAAFIEASM